MNFRQIKNSKTLIVGATSQVGKAIAHELQMEGASLILTGRDENKLSALQSEDIKIVPLDFSSDEALDRNLITLKEAVPELHNFIFTVAPPALPTSVKDENFIKDLELHMSVSVLGFSKVFQAIADKINGAGSVTAVLTEYVIGTPPEKTAAYVAAKTALQSLVQSMAIELGPAGIKCNMVAPGMINTPYSAHVPVRLKQIEEARNPMRRLCTPDDVAKAVKFLIGPESDFLNGVTLPVNGGSRMI